MAVTEADDARTDEPIASPAGSAWQVLDALGEGIYTIDPAGLCTFVNQAALQSLGYDQASDLLGRNMHDVIHHTRPDGAPYPRAECPLLQTAHGGHPVRLANETLWRRDGTPFLAEYSAYPMREGGRAAGSVITFREEFVREDARTRLAVQYAVSQVLTGSAGLDMMMDRVLETIGRGFQCDVGRYWKAGADLEFAAEWRRPGLTNAETAQPGPAAQCWQSKRAIQASSHEGTLAPIFNARSGFAFPVGTGATVSAVMEFFSQRIIPADASMLGAVEVLGQMVAQALDRLQIANALRDSERRFRAIAREAEAANVAKSLFLANMSHELRTPLSAILGYSEMLIEEVQDGETVEQVVGDIRKIETNARHLLGLINDVLDLSKVESGKMDIVAERFDVVSVVDDVRATAQTLVEKNRNTLAIHLASDLGSMHSDVTRVRQMLLNLLSNAAKFTTDGRITLSAAREAGPDGADRIRFMVADTGLGMTEEQLAKLFQRFQQADASTTRRFGGTGLGLSLTRIFSQLLGGDVDVSSVPGQGSIFTILLPATLPADGSCDR